MSTEAPEPPRQNPAAGQVERPGTSPAEPQKGRRAERRAERKRRRGEPTEGMLPKRRGRSFIETFVMRLVATAGIIGIGVAIAAIMTSQKSQGWLIGLVVSIVSVILAALLWSSRRL